jgi:hypothetical protein
MKNGYWEGIKISILDIKSAFMVEIISRLFFVI